MAPVDARDGGGAGRERAGVGVPAVGVPVDRIGLEVLDRQTCLELLATAPIGRVGLSIEALPVVLPVNFLLCTPPWCRDPVIVMCCGDGSKVDAALANHVVALEIDGHDAMAHSGWSVLVQGPTRLLADAPERSWAAGLPLRAWANAEADAFIELATDVIQGRRFGVARSARLS